MNKRQFEEFRRKLEKGLEKAYAKMIKMKREKNTPLVVWKDGKVVKLDPHKAPSTTTYK